MKNPHFAKKRRLRKRIKRAGGMTNYLAKVIGHISAYSLDVIMGVRF